MTKKLDQEIIDLFYNIYRLFRKKVCFNDRVYNLSILQIHLLIFLNRNPYVKIKDISRHFRISLPTTTVLTQRLINLRLLKKEKDKTDQRVVRISLTPKGKDLVIKLRQQRLKKLKSLLKNLSKTEKNQLIKILKKFTRNEKSI